MTRIWFEHGLVQSALMALDATCLQVASRKKSYRAQTLKLLLAYLLSLQTEAVNAAGRTSPGCLQPLPCLLGIITPVIVQQVCALTAGCSHACIKQPCMT